MRSRPLASALIVPVLALTACGSKAKDVDTASYTCADFNKSLATKGNDSAGNFINQLRAQAKLGKDKTSERRAITLGVYFACRGKPGNTKPADTAVTTAKQVVAGKFKLPAGPTGKKKSSK